MAPLGQFIVSLNPLTSQLIVFFFFIIIVSSFVHYLKQVCAALLKAGGRASILAEGVNRLPFSRQIAVI